MFLCDQCGECCRHIGKVPGMESFDRGDGVCRHLHSNKCVIYDARPLACRVDAMYERHFSRTMSREEYYKQTYETCKRLKNENREQYE